AGVLAEIKVQEGQTVPVQTLVAVLETEKGAVASAPAPAAAAPKSEPPKPEPPKPAPTPAATAAAVRPSGRPADGDGGGVMTAEQRLRTKSTPLVRKIAAEHSVDISRIPGSGYAGRVTKQDILGYIQRAPAAPAPIPGTRYPVPGGGLIEHPVVEPWPGDRVEPWSKIRKITADHM